MFLAMTTTETNSQPPNPLARSSVSRRAFLAGLPVAALALAACSTTSTATATAGNSSAATDSSSGAVSSSASASAATGVAPADGSVAALAMAFKATLSSDLQTALSHDYTLANAELWSNLPQSLLGGGMAGGGAVPS